VCTAELSVKLSSLPAVGMFRLSVKEAFHDTATVVFVCELESVNRDGSMEGVADVPAGITSFGPFFALSGRGRVLKSKEFDEPGNVSTVDELLALASRAGFDREKILEGFSETIGDSIGLLVGSTLKGMRTFGIANGDKPSLRRYNVILPEKHADRLPAEYAELKQSRIGIIGLGSIGSKVALSLARSGVRRFLLVDDDLLLPENICRNELSWAGVGIHKAEAVREALSLVAPNLEIGVRIHRVAGQESAVAAAAALKDLAACDLLVDATANADVFLRLAAVARMAKRPLCWGEVFAGGLGGLIARARPGIDPNPVAVRNAILSYLETQPPAPYRQAGGYDIEGQVPVIATDSDVTLIAGALSRFVLDALLRATESQYPYSAYLLGFRNEWIFSQPFDTQPITVSGPGWDDGPSASDEERLNAVKLLLMLAAERQDDHSDSATGSG
jgi:molybdopterin/thiamine biosynthesis adenylyltransferase